MFTKTIELFGKYRHLELTAVSLSLVTNSALEKDRVLRLLPEIQKLFPMLSESDYDEKTDVFKLHNDATETKDQMFFSAEKSRGFLLSWGIRVSVGSEKDIRALFAVLQDQLSIMPVNIQYVDARLHAVSEWEGNHYSVIWSAFFADTPVHGMFAGQTIAQDDLAFRGMLEEDKICLIEVQSNVRDSEIRQGKYKNDLLMAKLSIAKTRHFAPNANLPELAVQHVACSTDIACNNFAPMIVAPLDAALAIVVKEGKKS